MYRLTAEGLCRELLESEIHCESDVDNFECQYQQSLVAKKLQEFYRNHKFCDVVLIAAMDGIRVEAHRVILACSSDYFDAMFGGSLSESHSREIYLNQIDGVALRAIVDFMYYSKLEIRKDNAECLLRVASIFQLGKVAERGSEFMIKHLDASNCLGIALFAEQYNYQLLYRHAYAKICECFTELPDEEEFYELSVEQFSKFLKSDDLCVNGEEDVLRIVLKWVAHDHYNRDQHIPMLFRLIRFDILPPNVIEKEVMPVYAESDCQEVIAKSLKKRSDSRHTKRRNPKNKLTFISEWFKDENFLQAQVHDPVLNRWEKKLCKNTPNKRSAFQAAVLGDQLIFAGGRSEDLTASNIVDALDLKTFKWKNLPPMLQARHLFALAVLNGELYAVGGRGDDGVLQSVERYSPSRYQWEYVASTLDKRSEHAAAVLNGQLYVIDSAQGFECYNPESNSWIRRTPINASELPVNLVVVNNKLFSISGEECKLEQYDSVADTWKEVRSFGRNLKGVKCCGYGESLIIDVDSNMVMAYNTTTGACSHFSHYEEPKGKGILLTI